MMHPAADHPHCHHRDIRHRHSRFRQEEVITRGGLVVVGFA
jgi:hypothetical protein